MLYSVNMEKEKLIIPVKRGERLNLTVENLASSGDGICEYKGYTLFLPGFVTGDKVLAKVAKITPRFGVCRVAKLISPSSEREKPFCQFFHRCGGCQLQHLSYKKQTEFKMQVVKDSLKRVGQLELSQDPVFIPASHPFYYRNKGIFPVRKIKNKIAMGFYRRGSHRIVDVDECPVMHYQIDSIKEVARRIFEKHNLSIYNELSHEGILRNLIVRGSIKDKEYLIGLVTSRRQINKDIMMEELYDINSALKGDYKVVGIVQNINIPKTNIVLGDKNKVLWGRDYFFYTIGNIRYRLSLSSFSQINPFQSKCLNDIVKELLSDEQGLILDAYCGAGNLTLYLANQGRSLIGIEEHKNSVKNAIASAKDNKIKNCSFITGRVEEHLISSKGKNEFSAIILNPPRRGCSPEVIDAIIKTTPKKIIYVSCNPVTLARDLKKLCHHNYQLKDLKIIDMFPQTVHMETVVALEHKSN